MIKSPIKLPRGVRVFCVCEPHIQSNTSVHELEEVEEVQKRHVYKHKVINEIQIYAYIHIYIYIFLNVAIPQYDDCSSIWTCVFTMVTHSASAKLVIWNRQQIPSDDMSDRTHKKNTSMLQPVLSTSRLFKRNRKNSKSWVYAMTNGRVLTHKQHAHCRAISNPTEIEKKIVA